MSLQALDIVREMLSREIERIETRMDKMVLKHGRRVDYARFVVRGGFDSTRGHLLGHRDGTWQDHVRAARNYLDSCGPALSDMDDPTWITLPEKDLQQHAEFGRTAARITLLRDSLMARIEEKCCSDCEALVCNKAEHVEYDPTGSNLDSADRIPF